MPVQFPAFWWGYNSRQMVTPEISITTLIDQHVLSAELAGVLWALLARRASCLAVAGHYSGAGKTTTMTALSSFYPGDTDFVVARGRFEDFSFVPETDAAKTTVLVPEFSDHMPAYLWGPGAATVVRLRQQGYTFAGTIHADSVEEVLADLMAPPVSLTPPEVAGALNIILTQNIVPELQARRVQGVSWIYPTPRGPKGIGAKGLASWNTRDDLWHLFSSPETWAQLATWCGLPDTGALHAEVEARTAFLGELAAEGVTDFDAVDERIQAFQV